MALPYAPFIVGELAEGLCLTLRVRLAFGAKTVGATAGVQAQGRAFQQGCSAEPSVLRDPGRARLTQYLSVVSRRWALLS